MLLRHTHCSECCGVRSFSARAFFAPASLRISLSLFPALFLFACATPPEREVAPAHISRQANVPPVGEIPPPVMQSFALPRPKPKAAAETYSVVVNNVNVRELLFALARDARVNVDIHPGIEGTATLNAINQTLPQLLKRISRQVDIRFELDGPNLVVLPDTPFLRNYRIDYVNMQRDTTGAVAVTTQLTSLGGSGDYGNNAASNSGANNNSVTRIENRAQHHFWETLVQNVTDMLHETDKIFPAGSNETVREQTSSMSNSGRNGNSAAARPLPGSSTAAAKRRVNGNTPAGGKAPPETTERQEAETTHVRHVTYREAASVIAHPETGILSVRATARQHEKIQEFLDQVQASARRQVMIEATVAEVQLSENFQQGIDWNLAPYGTAGFRFIQKPSPGTGVARNSMVEIGYTNSEGNLAGTIRLLEAFGTVKVLSSPRISALNNQTAVLKVVDNSVYFTVKADTAQNQTTTVTTYTSTLNQVPVGFVMNVTPQISDGNQVLLNIRPSISRIVGYVADPNPALKEAGITSEIPVIRSREMESTLRIEDGNIAVMGGLMEDAVDNRDNGIPGLSRLPLVGGLFVDRNDTVKKSELVIFLRPIVIRDASIAGDYAGLKNHLPDRNFFAHLPDPRRQGIPADNAARADAP